MLGSEAAVTTGEATGSMGNMMVKGVFSYTLFGHEFWITTSTITIYLIVILLLVFAFIASRKIKKAKEVPGTFQNILELIVEKLDGMVASSLGRHAYRFRNYIGALFAFILVCNLSGIIGLRSPTADYGTTLPLGLISFFLIQINAFRTKKLRYFKSLAEPFPFLLPSNIIGEVSVPVSLSLRLFGNVLSGTMILSLWYAMIPWFAKIPISPFLHVYFDLFSGAIQTYVFSMLTMTYLSDKLD
ncbi:MAG: F0F1 ATP synthase subunit A [Lachnospiraceae bacterium]|nr:F0F1 ATP synthase subunit A [Lachnospiraceae bacterium]